MVFLIKQIHKNVVPIFDRFKWNWTIHTTTTTTYEACIKWLKIEVVSVGSSSEKKPQKRAKKTLTLLKLKYFIRKFKLQLLDNYVYYIEIRSLRGLDFFFVIFLAFFVVRCDSGRKRGTIIFDQSQTKQNVFVWASTRPVTAAVNPQLNKQ